MNRFKNEKWKLVLSGIAAFSPTIIGLILWNRLPDQLPIHFGINGEPTAYGPKSVYVFLFGFIMLILHFLALYITGKDPKNANVSDRIMNLMLWAVPVISLFVSVLIYSMSIGQRISFENFLTVLIALMLLIVGNYLPKTRQNNTIGIRLPWTLKDAEVWNTTHRYTGYMFVFAGILLLISLLLPQSVRVSLNMTVVIIAVCFPIVLSRNLYKRSRKDDK
ncbi:MAG: SdpI family protein [Erysipelotrichaceae bacterium]|nr:SdpI family protein [Erysipelotrichaceae bacterium]